MPPARKKAKSTKRRPTTRAKPRSKSRSTSKPRTTYCRARSRTYTRNCFVGGDSDLDYDVDDDDYGPNCELFRYHAPPDDDGLQASIGAAQTINDTNPAFQQPAQEATSFVGEEDQTVEPQTVQVHPTSPAATTGYEIAENAEEVQYHMRSLMQIFLKSPHYSKKKVHGGGEEQHDTIFRLNALLNALNDAISSGSEVRGIYMEALKLKSIHELQVHTPDELGQLWASVQNRDSDLESKIDEWALSEHKEIAKYRQAIHDAEKARGDIKKQSEHLRPVFTAIAAKTANTDSVFIGRITVSKTNNCTMDADWDVNNEEQLCGIDDVRAFENVGNVSNNLLLGDENNIAWVANMPKYFADGDKELTTGKITAWFISQLLAADGESQSSNGNSLFALTDHKLFWVSLQPSRVGKKVTSNLTKPLMTLSKVEEEELGSSVDVVDKILGDIGTVSVHGYDDDSAWEHADIFHNDDKTVQKQALTGFTIFAAIYQKLLRNNSTSNFNKQYDEIIQKNPVQPGRWIPTTKTVLISATALVAAGALLNYSELDVVNSISSAFSGARQMLSNWSTLGNFAKEAGAQKLGFTKWSPYDMKAKPQCRWSDKPQLVFAQPQSRWLDFRYGPASWGPGQSSQYNEPSGANEFWFLPEPVKDYVNTPHPPPVSNSSSQFWY